MSKSNSSEIWTYFTLCDAERAKCKLCNNEYSRKGRTTTAMKKHLKAMHKTEFSELEKSEKRKHNASKTLELASSSHQSTKSDMKQISHQECVDKTKQWDNKSLKSLAVDNSISEMVALEDLPFSFVESVGFVRLMKHLCPSYNLKSHQYFTSFICDKLYGKKRLNQKQHFLYVEAILQVKESLCLYASTNNKIPQLTSEEWMIIEKLIGLLRPFEEVTKELNETEDSETHKSVSLKETMSLLMDTSDSEEEDDMPLLTFQNPVHLLIRKTVTEYSAEERVANDVEPLTWWKVNKERYGLLFPVVRHYLVTPPTSVPSKRMFSCAGLLYIPHRNRLEGEKAFVQEDDYLTLKTYVKTDKSFREEFVFVCLHCIIYFLFSNEKLIVI
ncbi:hypothetical protein ILUMI_15922 [Ignelater luminosus]|uniref:BED-type domain-containing protein n=1 Tax=Ignelater luminosus TaxID=2038154 RepID=A0A8K0G922_IGNLU|nr:hypothetical protein ILUMI_15922 [Ignelater luminosus]